MNSLPSSSISSIHSSELLDIRIVIEYRSYTTETIRGSMAMQNFCLPFKLVDGVDILLVFVGPDKLYGSRKRGSPGVGMAGYWYVGSILRKYCPLRLTYVEKDQCSNNLSQRFSDLSLLQVIMKNYDKCGRWRCENRHIAPNQCQLCWSCMCIQHTDAGYYALLSFFYHSMRGHVNAGENELCMSYKESYSP